MAPAEAPASQDMNIPNSLKDIEYIEHAGSSMGLQAEIHIGWLLSLSHAWQPEGVGWKAPHQMLSLTKQPSQAGTRCGLLVFVLPVDQQQGRKLHHTRISAHRIQAQAGGALCMCQRTPSNARVAHLQLGCQGPAILTPARSVLLPAGMQHQKQHH